MFQSILSSRYLRKEIGEQTLSDVIYRVTEFVGKNENEGTRQWWRRSMERGEWLPSSPILMNAGTPHPMLSACFVLDIKDDMAEIFNTLKNAALIQQHGGGVGFNFSNLRERGATVWSTNGVASGVVSFMRVFNEATNIVKQGGRRRGACIAVLDVDHPDILDFIKCKAIDGDMNAFNLSVRVSDEFMRLAYENKSYNLISRTDGRVVGELNAADVLDKIVHSFMETGDPGILFGDTIERNNPTPFLGKLTGVNPCGEVSLYDMEACNLASINLEKFADKPDIALADVVYSIVRFLDDTIDVNEFPLPEIAATVKKTRKIGLGVTGLHGYLIKKGLAYDSIEGLDEAGRVLELINLKAAESSYDLAVEKGQYPASIMSIPGPRNASRTCIAPTGTISILMDTSSSGIEPVFSWAYTRKADGIDYVVVPSILHELIDSGKIICSDREALFRQIEENGGSLQGMTIIPKEIQNICKTAHEITPESHINMLVTAQKYVDNNISKTINIGSNYPARYWDLIYQAWVGGCRGITFYIDGSKHDQVLTPIFVCPSCGGKNVVTGEGCRKCNDCGWSSCVV
jgi:ribonucleoside-diphosphate reductase alpha chain